MLSKNLGYEGREFKLKGKGLNSEQTGVSIRKRGDVKEKSSN